MSTSDAAGTVQSLAERYSAIWNSHDLKQMAEIYAEDSDFVNVIGLRYKGVREIVDAHVFLHEMRMGQSQLTSKDITIRFLSPDVAVLHDTWELTGDPGAEGWEIHEDRRGVLIHVIQNGPEGWRIAASQNTDIIDIPDV